MASGGKREGMKLYRGYIKMLTSIGGENEHLYECYNTPQAEQAFNEWLDTQSKVEGVILYRGYRLEEQYLDSLYEGAIIEPLNITQEFHPAFTPNLLRASAYMNEMGSDLGRKVFFELHTSGKTMVDISKYSLYPEETEYQPIADAKWVVKSVQDKGFRLNVVLYEQ